jgi:hypothetical protein
MGSGCWNYEPNRDRQPSWLNAVCTEKHRCLIVSCNSMFRLKAQAFAIRPRLFLVYHRTLRLWLRVQCRIECNLFLG